MYPASSYCLHYFIQHFIAIFIHFCAVNKFNQSINQSINQSLLWTQLDVRNKKSLYPQSSHYRSLDLHRGRTKLRGQLNDGGGMPSYQEQQTERRYQHRSRSGMTHHSCLVSRDCESIRRWPYKSRRVHSM